MSREKINNFGIKKLLILGFCVIACLGIIAALKPLGIYAGIVSDTDKNPLSGLFSEDPQPQQPVTEAYATLDTTRNPAIMTFRYDDQRLNLSDDIPAYSIQGSVDDLPAFQDPLKSGTQKINVEINESMRNYDFDKNANALVEIFGNCRNLCSITGLNNFNTSYTESMYSMFWNCTNLTYIDFKGFNASNIKSMRNAICGCHSLTGVDFGDSFDTSKVEDFCFFIQDCTSLEKVTLNFDTSSAINMYQMFRNDVSLKEILLGDKFKPSSCCQSIEGMFWDCKSLKKIYCDTDWTGISEDKSIGMFWGCDNLKGYDIGLLKVLPVMCKFDSAHTNSSYARRFKYGLNAKGIRENGYFTLTKYKKYN